MSVSTTGPLLISRRRSSPRIWRRSWRRAGCPRGYSGSTSPSCATLSSRGGSRATVRASPTMSLETRYTNALRLLADDLCPRVEDGHEEHRIVGVVVLPFEDAFALGFQTEGGRVLRLRMS